MTLKLNFDSATLLRMTVVEFRLQRLQEAADAARCRQCHLSTSLSAHVAAGYVTRWACYTVPTY